MTRLECDAWGLTKHNGLFRVSRMWNGSVRGAQEKENISKMNMDDDKPHNMQFVYAYDAVFPTE